MQDKSKFWTHLHLKKGAHLQQQHKQAAKR